jgi:hypothetical protein
MWLAEHQVSLRLGAPSRVDGVFHRPLVFSPTAGRRASVTVDLRTGLAQVEERGTGVWDALVWLHKMPGPHNAAIRGNWAITRAWRWFSDATVYLLLFLSASGVYLWSVIRAERRAGLLCLGGGALTFVLLLLAIVG